MESVYERHAARLLLHWRALTHNSPFPRCKGHHQGSPSLTDPPRLSRWTHSCSMRHSMFVIPAMTIIKPLLPHLPSPLLLPPLPPPALAQARPLIMAIIRGSTTPALYPMSRGHVSQCTGSATRHDAHAKR